MRSRLVWRSLPGKQRKTRWGGVHALGTLSADRAEDTELLQALMNAGSAERMEFLG
jgi:hypothetical protein